MDNFGYLVSTGTDNPLARLFHRNDGHTDGHTDGYG
jgi:hypothetical protein